MSNLTKANDALGRCKDVSFTSDGHKTIATIGELPFPKFGTDSRAWNMTLHAEGFQTGAHILTARKNATLMLLAMLDSGRPSIDNFQKFSTTAYGKPK